MKTKKTDSINLPLIFFIVCTGLYMVLKIFRNSLNAAAGGQGGIWNLFNILFVAVAMYMLLTRKNALRSRPTCINWALGYSFLAFSISLLFLRSLSIAQVFSLSMIFFFPSVMCVFYIYGQRGISEVAKKSLYVVFYAVALFATFLMLNRVQGTTEIYQSDVYFALCLFPFVMLFGKKTSFYLPLVLLITVIILSAKRTATLAVIAALLVFYIVQIKQGRNPKAVWGIIWKIILIAVIIFVVYSYLAANYEINILDRLENIRDDGGSGRDKIYLGILKKIGSSHPLSWFTGNGHNAVINVYGRSTSAHSDFIEILFDYGFFSVLILLGFYISMMKECSKMIKAQFYGAPAFGASIVIAIFMSLFSNFMITFTHIIGISAFWGVCLAEWTNYKNLNGIKKC